MSQQTPQPERDEERYLGLTGAQLNAAFLGVVGVVVAGVCAWLFLFDGIDTVTGKKETGQRALVAQQAANGAVLKLSDLPEGWKARLPGEQSDLEFEFSERCKMLAQDTFEGEIANAASDELYGPSGLTVDSDASVFAIDSKAGDAYGAFTEAVSCRDELIAAMTESIRSAFAEDGVDPAAVQVSVTFDQLPAPAVGDATAAMYRLAGSVQVPDQQVSFTVDLLMFRHERMVGQLVYTAIDSAPSAEEELQLAQLAAAKLVAASASLPEA
jgi:hypothetical protein